MYQDKGVAEDGVCKNAWGKDLGRVDFAGVRAKELGRWDVRGGIEGGHDAPSIDFILC